MIRINTEQCAACGLCAGDCVSAALALNPKAALIHPENCIGCGHCIAVCPMDAVLDDELKMEEALPVSPALDSAALLGQMRSRRSCRHYKADPVPETSIQALLDAARACPTAKNRQGTRYIVVTERIPLLLDQALDALGRIGAYQREHTTQPDELRRAENFVRWNENRKSDKDFDPLFFHAPMLLLFLSDQDGACDAAAAASYAELLAPSLGLGCLYSGYFAACAAMSQEIQNTLGLRDNERVVRCLVVGYPKLTFRRTAPRKPADVTRL